MNMGTSMKWFRGSCMALLTLACALPVVSAAQDDESAVPASEVAPAIIPGTPWYVSPMLSTVLPDSARGLDQGYGGSISVGKKLLEGLAVEIGGSYAAADAKSGGGSSKLLNTSVSALVFPSTRFPWVYGLLGAGYSGGQDLPGAVDEYNGFALETGVGLLYPVNFFKRFLLRADVRFRLDNPDTRGVGTSGTKNPSFYDDVFNVGALIPLGPTPAPAAATVAAAPLPADSDNDGVLDDADRCPGTPAGAVVDAQGCEKDSDKDGVPDRLDQCPDTPQGTAVNEVGCPLDSDKDGVGDASDECPNTPAGAKVLANGCTLLADCRKPREGEAADANGCAVEKKFVLRGVKFDFDSDRLTEAAKGTLGEVAETLKAYPDVKVELEGHTCNIGPAEYNLSLSDRRAVATKRFLVGLGIAGDRMTTVGYGLTQPIDSNDTEAGRENNRRVEMKVTGGDVPSGDQGAAEASPAP